MITCRRLQYALTRALLACSLNVLAGCIGPTSAENATRAQKEYELAVGLLGEQNIPAAFEHLFKARDLDPHNPEPYQLLGNLYLLRGDLANAEASLRKAKALAEKNPSYGPPFVAEVENSLGVVLVHQKRYDEAIALLRETASNLLNRTPYLAWGNLGWAYYEKGQYTDAVAALTQSVRQQARFCLGYYRLGQAYLALRELERAEEALTHCLEVPDEGCQTLQDAWHLRGQARARLGQREDAIRDFERCVELSAGTPTGRACQSYLEATH
ncbi:MAG TPA: tetratricopeptide repeat protein [Polyangiaceae bacterium]|nr:tetratricopeptide repeat protein [Polyangiaceae bacterium]